MTKSDEHHLDSVEKLRAVVGEPGTGIELKLYDHVFDEARAYVAQSPFVVLCTADADGHLGSRRAASPPSS